MAIAIAALLTGGAIGAGIVLFAISKQWVYEKLAYAVDRASDAIQDLFK